MTDSLQGHSEARSAEESRSWRAVLASSKNEMLRFARNDRSLANVILRHVVPKNLVHGEQYSPVQRTRCFAPLSMTLRGGPRCTGIGHLFIAFNREANEVHTLYDGLERRTKKNQNLNRTF